MKNWLRRQIVNLIGAEIDDIARRAYVEGCYQTSRRMREEQARALMDLQQHNEKLTEMLVTRHAIAPSPPIIIKRVEP